MAGTLQSHHRKVAVTNKEEDNTDENYQSCSYCLFAHFICLCD